MNQHTAARLKLIVVMLLFGTIGIFRKYIDLPSSGLAVARGLIGAAFLLLVVLITGKKLDKAAMLLASKALGHNRIEVVAINYIRGL